MSKQTPINNQHNTSRQNKKQKPNITKLIRLKQNTPQNIKEPSKHALNANKYLQNKKQK